MNYKKPPLTFIETIITRLQEALLPFPLPLVDQIIKEFGHDPYLILVSCLLSLRARDRVTIHVCRALFSLVRTPQALLALPQEDLETIIHKTGYYKTKAHTLRRVSHLLLELYEGKVPSEKAVLESIPGIGPKTANLVVGIAYHTPALCVDTHVHRISNIFKLITTTTVEDTQKELEKMLPQRYWIEWNRLLVMLGQNICTPPRPQCYRCPLQDICPKRGVIPRTLPRKKNKA